MAKHKSLKRIITKINLSSLFFFCLSIMSVTFAWFAYHNIVDNNLEVELKSWEVEIKEGETELSRELLIQLEDFYPGCQTYTREIDIQNKGDLPAIIDFQIESISIMGENFAVNDQNLLLDNLSHNYPFFINFYLNTNYIETNQISTFNITIGWPLDSGDDALDSSWGNDAYDFYQAERAQHTSNPSYEMKSAIEIKLRLNVSQYVEEENHPASDNLHRVGTEVSNAHDLHSGNSSYVNPRDYVIEPDNLKSSTTVKVISKYETALTISGKDSLFSSSSGTNTKFKYTEWTKTTGEEIIMAISTDMYDSKLKYDRTSPRILGYINESSQATRILNDLKSKGGSIAFNGAVFSALTPSSSSCFWIGDLYHKNVSDTYGHHLVVEKASGVTVELKEYALTSASDSKTCYSMGTSTITK